MPEINWAEVHPDLLHLIAKKLGDISNFIRFRAVCKKWRSAARLSDPPPQLPWFLKTLTEQVVEDVPLLFIPRSDIRFRSELDFYSLCSNKTHTLQLPEIHRKRLAGPSKRYILVEESPYSDRPDALSPFLLNPLTGTRIPLPFKTTRFHRPVYLGPDPDSTSGNDVLAVVILIGRNRDARSTDTLAVWRSNDGNWTSVEVPRGSKGVYYKGMFYNSVNNTETLVIDVLTGGVVSTIPHPRKNMYCDYLIEAYGDLLQVVNTFQSFDYTEPVQDCRFDVYCLKELVGKPRWEKLSSIGDRMLFLDSSNGFCMKASDFGGFKGNCIYFVTYWKRNSEDRGRYVLGRYDMEERRAEVLHRDREFDGTWFVPCPY
ncbi:hypothetical protein LUZ60_016275 [Juncus effusus]|nr:hypothetical protein LUZ60_016275 [Juncus effusus]